MARGNIEIINLFVGERFEARSITSGTGREGARNGTPQAALLERSIPMLVIDNERLRAKTMRRKIESFERRSYDTRVLNLSLPSRAREYLRAVDYSIFSLHI